MRTGTTPYGRTLTRFMPWRYYARLSDDELRAIWTYVQAEQRKPATEAAEP
jgi:hypothetical protein